MVNVFKVLSLMFLFPWHPMRVRSPRLPLTLALLLLHAGALAACGSMPMAYRGQALAPTGSAPGFAMPALRPGEVFLLEEAENRWTGAFTLVEYQDLMMLEVLLFARGPDPLPLSPEMGVLRDFSGRVLQPLSPSEAANRFMGPGVNRPPFNRGPFRFKNDYWVAEVDYGYPQIPEEATGSEGALRETLSATLAEDVSRRRTLHPLTLVEELYSQGLTPGTEVGGGTTLRFNLTWRNEHPKTYPLELRVPAARAALRLGAR